MNAAMVFISVSQLKVMTAQHLLSEAGIESVVLDQIDSAHGGLFGDIKLFVAKDLEGEARKILKENEVID